MNKLTRCREGLEKMRAMLAGDDLLTQHQMQQALSLMTECEREVAGYPGVLCELRAAHQKLTRCEVKSEFLDFLETQYRARGLSSPRKIATLVVLEEATNSLKRAIALTMEQMRRLEAA
jgi:hypothetical protein